MVSVAIPSFEKPALTLDGCGYYPFRLTEHGGKFGLLLSLKNTQEDSKLIPHLYDLLRLETDGGRPLHAVGSQREAIFDRQLFFPLSTPLPQTLTLTMGSDKGPQPVSQLEVVGNADALTLRPGPKHALYQLAISETRGLAQVREAFRGVFPYSRAAREGYSPALHAPITDLHTHSTAQIRARDLFNLAVEKDEQARHDLAEGKTVDAEGRKIERVCYPVGLVGKDYLDVEDKSQPTVEMTAREFAPMKEEALPWEIKNNTCPGIPVSELSRDQADAIIRKMEFGPDQTIDFSDMDPGMYRYRNPLAKHPAVAKGIIHKIAEDYARMGIRYAELSTGSMLDPAWLKEMIEAIDDIEANGVMVDGVRKEVTLRFLVNLSRTATAADSAVWLEKVKYLLRHPYIVGDDMTGYEANKNTDFHWVLSNLLQWGSASENTDLKASDWNFQDWIIHRIHGGETNKNMSNVGDTINLAHRYFGGRIRIGHALYHLLNPDQRRKLNELTADPTRDLFAVERCNDANQVYRSKPLVHMQPPFLNAPTTFGSDGGGAIVTTPTGLAYSALAMGKDLNALAQMHQWEEGYIERQLGRDVAKKQAFAQRYGEGKAGTEAFLQGYKQVVDRFDKSSGFDSYGYLPPEFKNKTPFLCVGPSGSSWRALDYMDQETAARAAHFLVKALDPKTVYFVLGRVQNEGFSRALDKAILKHNKDHPTNKFLILGRYNGADKGPVGEMAESITWLQPIRGSLDMVPANMIKFVKEAAGKVIAFAGSAFSAGMVGLAQDRKLPYATQVPRRGLFEELHETTNTDSSFRNFNEFVAHVFQQEGTRSLFRTKEEREQYLRPGIDLGALAEEVQQMKITALKKKELPVAGDASFNRFSDRW